MKRICLLVLVGLPAAGKTTFCNWFLNVPQQHFKILHFCYDEFLKIDHFLQPAAPTDDIYKAQRQQILEWLKTVLNALSNNKEIPASIKSKIDISKNAAQEDYIILLDDNHYYRSMRYKIFQLCKMKGLPFGQIYFECDRQTSLDRNTTRSVGRLPASVIEKMTARLQTPSSIHHWEATTLTVRSEESDYTLHYISNFLSKAFNNIPKNEAVSAEAHNQVENSLFHNLDILLRRRIGELLTLESCKNVKRNRAAELNERRKEILKHFRNIDLVEARFGDFVNLLENNKEFEI